MKCNTVDKILFCGTGAADYTEPVPGEEFRKYTHSLLNDVIQIDFGRNAYLFEEQSVLSERYKSVKNVLITHSHSDHFHPDFLKRLAKDNGGITLYIDKSVVNLISDENIKVVGVSTGDLLEIEGHKVYVLPSNHFVSFSETTHHYLIDTPSGKTLFYGLDSAWLMTYETEFLIKHPADFFVLDCTLGRITGDKRIFEHNSVNMLEYMVNTIRNHGMIKKDGVIYADHLAKTLHPKHDEVVKDLETFGVKVAYDGLCVEF